MGCTRFAAQGRRVQFMWFRLKIPGANYTGAQTLPREIRLAPPGSITGLLFRPIPEVSTLHVGSGAPEVNRTLELAPGANDVTIVPKDGLHCHIQLGLVLPSIQHNVSIKLTVRAFDPETTRAGLGSLEVVVSQDTLRRRQLSVGGRAANLSTTGREVHLDVFVDGVLTEVFANGGERVLTNSAADPYVSGTALHLGVNGQDVGAVTKATMNVWGMSRAID